MSTGGDIAPKVRSILDAARERAASRADTGGERVAVDARSLTGAFEAAEADGRVPLIAEVKPTSPTTDGERTDDPVELAESMVAGGAAALSVLTEPEHFGGSTDALERIRAAVDVPVLRKDFVVRESQLDAVESDVLLLIVRFLDEEGTDDLADLLAAARERGFQVLVETHTAEEVERALAAGAEIVGVNNRDLAKLEVDLGTFEDVAPEAPENVTLIAESGIATTNDALAMREAGADALLVGSAIMDAAGGGDVEANTRRLVTAESDATAETAADAETETHQ
ncbi:indole-3-glycerol phosphate synthase [Halosimplex pelagicum]|uniref:Indole-3-glycerol phosphate synthase n=1 Tax=Halosimplex pelagicum TaxID=869886 RepID=A0A7D5PA08_9EURY|nr:indole-3-glycerol phosphate synthase [Halosimplex pelagicum]QLH82544.1 indole-3-glycerol-phosphate synthase [Halosimplex pelagicum]